MQNILVTGGAGFIGSNFVRFLQENEPGAKIINLDKLTYAGSIQNLEGLPHPEQHIFVEGDICDRDLVSRLLLEHSVDTIVHFAAETHVDRSIFGPAQFIQTNINGTFTLLEAARQYWLEGSATGVETRFHHISTDEVFGTLAPHEPAWTEETPYAPNSPYAASKASSDHLVRAYGHTYGLNYTITNCSNNYGPYQFPEKLIPLMILNALHGQPLPVYGDGGQIRDWLYVEDHCEAIWMVLKKGTRGETYNIGGGTQPENIEVVHHLCASLDEALPNSPYVPHASLIKYVADRPGHDRRYAMDITKINRQLGWQPRNTLGEGLQKTIHWYLSNEDWVQSMRSKGDYQDWLQRNYVERAEK